MTFERRRKRFWLCTLVLIGTGLLLKALSLWEFPYSAGYNFEKKYNSFQNLKESFKHFNANLEYVENVIIARLQNIEKSSKDYLIYDCSPYMEGTCGGWNDRITGVINTLMLSLVVNKRFRLAIDKPCETKDYFVPNKINWFVKPNILSSKNVSKTIFYTGGTLAFYKNVTHSFQSFVNLFRTSWDAIDVFRVTKNIKEKIPWICNVHHADVYKLIFNVLFKPSDLTLRPISELHLNKSKKLVCAHVRIGHNIMNKRQLPSENRFPMKNISLIFDFLKRFDPTAHYVYIATDTPKVKELSKKTFYKNFIDIPGKIMHLDLEKGKGECEGYGKSLREWWVLTKCDVLVLTQSGFGLMAAYLRDNNKPLYCTNAGKLFPCSRYNILEHYPLEMHIPRYIPISRRHNKTHDYCPPGGLQKAQNLPWYLKGTPE